MTLTPFQLETWTARLLEAAGLDPSEAADAADIYRRASERRGRGHHDRDGHAPAPGAAASWISRSP